MKLHRILALLCAAPLLTACGVWSGAGPIKVPDLPEDVRQPCPHPRDVVRGLGDWEIMAGRLGDELIECGAEKQVGVDGYDGVRGAVIARRNTVGPQ